MTSNNVIVTIKLCLDVGNYFILCNFGGRIIRGFKVIEGSLQSQPTPLAGSKKRNGLSRVNDNIREMSSRKHCGYKLQIVFRAHGSIIFTRDLGMR